MSNKYADNHYTWTVICHWELLRTPLTPFIGVFYNSIANYQTAQKDLQLLEDFVASLQPARRLSNGIDKYYQLCSTFFEVAEAYVWAKMQQQQFGSNRNMDPEIPAQALEPAIGEFDEYLTTLGLFDPPSTTVEAEAALPDGAGSSNYIHVNNHSQQQQVSDTANLPDWYSANMSLYGLLEQDFSGMNDMGFDISGDVMTYV